MMPSGLAATVRAYDHLSHFYDLLYGKVLQHGREVLARALQEASGHDLLELGVGSGLMLPLYPQRFRVVGVDVSPGMLELARQRATRLGLHEVELHQVDGEDTGLPDHAFDHVILPYVYSVTPYPFKLLHEAHRVCRVGGRIWILNHFSGFGLWDQLGRPLEPFARWVGFRPDFPYQTYVTDLQLPIETVQTVNLFGLSRLVQIKRNQHMPQGLLRAHDELAGRLSRVPGKDLATL